MTDSKTDSKTRSKTHAYQVQVRWTGNRGQGTQGYRTYGRNHEITSGDKPPLSGSADPAFRGDPTCYNPEELLVASLSSCHMLWYLHLCANAGIVVTDYVDRAAGTMMELPSGAGRFEAVVLKPVITLAPDSDAALAAQMHTRAHEQCFIANSVNFPVHCQPEIKLESGKTD